MNPTSDRDHNPALSRVDPKTNLNLVGNVSVAFKDASSCAWRPVSDGQPSYV